MRFTQWVIITQDKTEHRFNSWAAAHAFTEAARAGNTDTTLVGVFRN